MKEIQLERADSAQQHLNKGSHQKVLVCCDFKCSKNCKQEYVMEFRRYTEYKEKYGKIICLQCSRFLKFSNRNNPNTKYKSLDDNFFKKIDSKEKAYLLGWIGSDGNIDKRGFSISINVKDIECLEILKNIICKELPIKTFRSQTSHMCKFVVNSQEISRDLCNLFKINPGKKSHTVKFPDLNQDLIYHFLRGYFEGDGTLSNIKCKTLNAVSITSSSKEMLLAIKKIFPEKSYITRDNFLLCRKEALSFLRTIYKDCDFLFLKRKFEIFKYWDKNFEFNSTKNRLRGANHPNYKKHFSQETRDKMSRVKRDNPYMAKINFEIASLIRKEYLEENISSQQLGKKFNLSNSAICEIISNKSWKDPSYIPPKNTKNRYRVFSKKDIESILELLKSGYKIKYIADTFNVERHSISRIKKKEFKDKL